MCVCCIFYGVALCTICGRFPVILHGRTTASMKGELFLFSIWFSTLEMSDPVLSLLPLAAFAENLQDNITCMQTL